jgi:chromosome segregation ATPase
MRTDITDDGTMADKDDGRDDVRWLSYDELAEARGISRELAIRLSFRRKWPRRDGNDQTARVAVPLSELVPKKQTPDAAHDDIPHVISRLTDVFSVAVSSLTSRAEAAEKRAERAETEVATLRDELDQSRATAQAAEAQARGLLKQADDALSAERTARMSAETEVAELRDELEQLRAEAEADADAAKAVAEDVRAIAQAAKADAADAQEKAQAAEAEAAQLRQEAEQARAVAAEVQRTVEELQAKKDTATETASERAAAISTRIDEAKFRRLQKAEEARQRLGLWGRLKDAWRGD